MSTSLYDATIRTYLQTLSAIERVLTRAAEHCPQQGLSLEELAEVRLYHDMLPFRFQVMSTINHSVNAIEGVRKGLFTPSRGYTQDFAAMQKAVSEAVETLSKISADEVNGFEGREMFFEVGENKLPFTAEDFLLSFSLPNFYFHASMTYGILRSKGVPLGKRDFLGRMRLKK
jgi:hypothetical protein